VVAKVFTSKSGNTFLNIGASYPNQTFTGWIPPASPVNKSPILSGSEGKHVRITGRIEMYRGKPEIRINAAEQLEVELAFNASSAPRKNSDRAGLDPAVGEITGCRSVSLISPELQCLYKL
jgi:hypothetical protein